MFQSPGSHVHVLCSFYLIEIFGSFLLTASFTTVPLEVTNLRELADNYNLLIKSHYLCKQYNWLLEITFSKLLNNLIPFKFRNQERKLTKFN